MSFLSRNGYARVRPRDPRACAACDRCGMRWDLDALTRQFDWTGARLTDTGYLVCRFCLDTPQEQNRIVILPPDPVPRRNPRPPAYFTPQSIIGQTPPTSPENQGFSQYVVDGVGSVDPDPTAPNPLQVKNTLLDTIVTLSGVALPASATDQSVTIISGNVPQVLLPAAARNWLLLYNPSNNPAQIALAATTVWGLATNLILGPGQAYFWATAQGLGTAYQGAVSLIGLWAGAPFWAFDDIGGTYMRDGSGNVVVDGSGNAIVLGPNPAYGFTIGQSVIGDAV